MSERDASYLCAPGPAAQLHADVQEYAVAVNASVAIVHEGVSPIPLSGAALFAITADLLAMHRAVLCLCHGGWAFTSVTVLRSMIDLFLSAFVIVEVPSEAEYRGFKYTHFFLKSQRSMPGATTETRRSVAPQLERAIACLPPHQQARARQFVFQAPLRPYWYSPEYARPADVLERIGRPDIGRAYSLLSGGAHGGFIGLRVLKDDPDRVDPNPRRDPRSQQFTLLASSRLLLETMNIRDAFENGAATGGFYRELLDRLLAIPQSQQL